MYFVPIQGGGQFVTTHTDNKTYFAGSMCIFGKENIWWILSTNIDKSLPAGVYEQILADFTKFGFKADNIASADTSPLYLRKMSAHPSNCP